MDLLKPGQEIFRNVRIVDFNGGGGQSYTFVAENTAHGAKPWEKRLFVKQYNDLVLGTKEFEEIGGHYELMRERLADKAHFLCLPNIVGQISDSIVAVYPFIDGKSLEDWTNEGITKEQSIRFSFGITTAVQALHRARIAHLDLKPQNVIIDYNDRRGEYFVHLIDVDAAMIDGKSLRADIYGSPGYMSPEHVSDFHRKFIGRPSDIYSLGIMFCELLFQRYPFDRFGDASDVLSGRIELPDNVVAPNLKRLIENCFETDARRRPSATDLLRGLNEADLYGRGNKKSGRRHQTGNTSRRASGATGSFGASTKDTRGERQARSATPAHKGSASPRRRAAAPKKISRVRISQPGGFERNYFESTNLRSRNLRGSTLSAAEEKFSGLSIDLVFRDREVVLSMKTDEYELFFEENGAAIKVVPPEIIKIVDAKVIRIERSSFFGVFRSRHTFVVEAFAD